VSRARILALPKFTTSHHWSLLYVLYRRIDHPSKQLVYISIPTA
jgi:hypothetical protein